MDAGPSDGLLQRRGAAGAPPSTRRRSESVATSGGTVSRRRPTRVRPATPRRRAPRLRRDHVGPGRAPRRRRRASPRPDPSPLPRAAPPGPAGHQEEARAVGEARLVPRIHPGPRGRRRPGSSVVSRRHEGGRHHDQPVPAGEGGHLAVHRQDDGRVGRRVQRPRALAPRLQLGLAWRPAPGPASPSRRGMYSRPAGCWWPDHAVSPTPGAVDALPAHLPAEADEELLEVPPPGDLVRVAGVLPDRAPPSSGRSARCGGRCPGRGTSGSASVQSRAPEHGPRAVRSAAARVVAVSSRPRVVQEVAHAAVQHPVAAPASAPPPRDPCRRARRSKAARASS